MDIQSRKIEFIQAFLKLQNEETILEQEKTLQKKMAKLVGDENHSPMSIKELNQRIDQSMSDSENGRLSKASDLKAKIEKWN